VSEMTDDEKIESDKEFKSLKRYKNAEDAANIFENDDLVVQPGTFHYSTYGYTVLEWIIEKVGEKSFALQLETLCKDLGLKNTRVDVPEVIIPNRARGYHIEVGEVEKNVADYAKSSAIKVVNAPPVDMSNKFAGGGIISTGPDLLKFGNALLFSLQNDNGILKTESLKILQRGNNKNTDPKNSYGFGFDRQVSAVKPWLENYIDAFGHTGGAIDASSVFRIYPVEKTGEEEENSVKGMVIVILTNTYGISCRGLADEIAMNYLQNSYKQ